MSDRILVQASQHGVMWPLRILLVVAVLAAPRALGKPSGPVTQTTGTIRILAALVGKNMEVTPVPLHLLRLMPAHGDTVSLRTSLDGRATLNVPPGPCELASLSSVSFLGALYRWDIMVSIVAGETTEITLTNDNALMVAEKDSSIQDGPASSDPAAKIFLHFKRSIFRIQAGLSSGSGFLADTLDGVILTNAHVVEHCDPLEISVVMDESTRVRAQVLADDTNADIAVLRVSPELLGNIPRVKLQQVQGQAPAVTGERLLALGFPLHQDLVMTTGIVSSVRAGAIISDVNLNPGNSGGPLLNLHGEAVAMTTFLDTDAQVGPGISGSILIDRAGPALVRAGTELLQTMPPAADRLPCMPLDRMDVARLKAYAAAAAPVIYEPFENIELGGFDLSIQTPPQIFVTMKRLEKEIAKDRKKREELAGVPEEERYSETREFRDWTEHVGDLISPVVSFRVIPAVGETGGSRLLRLVVSSDLQAQIRFRADLRSIQVFRNREPVEPIRGGHVPVRILMETGWSSLKDVADQGFYVFDPEVFRPDSAGTPPSIVVAARDLKDPEKLKCCELHPDIVARIWNDFELFYNESRPDYIFTPADSRTARGRKPQRALKFLGDDVDWFYDARSRYCRSFGYDGRP